MKFHNIGMVGPFVNQKMGSLPTFDTQRDQGRMVWLLDGTLWFGADTEWIKLQKSLSDSEIASGLIQITEGVNTGWRLFDRDPDFYGNIGSYAIDISSPIPELNNRGGAISQNSFAQGLGTISQNANQCSTGKYNVGTNGNTIYEIGIGVDDNHRSNAFETYTTGLVTAPQLTVSLINSDNTALITKEFFDIHSGGSGLQRITEGSQSGWRLIGQDGANRGEIGVEAIDMSISNIVSSIQGATGNYSFAQGYNTIAQGVASHTIGQYNVGTDTNTIHETGIGTSNTNRMNAFEIYRDGTLTAPESTTTLINSRGDKSLVTKEYTDDTYLTETYADTKYLTINNATAGYYSKSESDGRYLTETYADTKYLTINNATAGYYSKSESDGRYYTKSISDGRYVNVTGDTMTGNLTMSNSDIYMDQDRTIYWELDNVNWPVLYAGYNSVNGYHCRIGGNKIDKIYLESEDQIRILSNHDEFPSKWPGVILKYFDTGHLDFSPKNTYNSGTSAPVYLGVANKRWMGVYSNRLDSNGDIKFSGLPTSEPSTNGYLWRDGDYVKIKH